MNMDKGESLGACKDRSYQKFSENWTFAIKIDSKNGEDRRPDDVGRTLAVPVDVKDSFATDGFAVFPRVLSAEVVEELNDRLEEILRGRYDRTQKPDKSPKLLKNEYPKPSTVSDSSATKIGPPFPECASGKGKSNKVSYAAGPLGFSGNYQNVKVLQVINVHKADSLFRRLAVSPVLGQIVAEIAGWTHVGTRLAQDQIWAKPPGAPPLTFHRDSPYFMFAPSDVITVWVALDDMDEEEIGPLQYVKGSHRWSDGRIGSANQFFDSQGGMDLLESAAARSGESTVAFESMAGLLAGGISVHDGRTWHGSGPNQSRSRPRRGLGLHFVPANVRFTAEAAKSTLWKRYLGDGSVDPAEVALPEEDFPIVWMPSSFPKKRARAMRIAIPSLLFLLFIMIETTLAWAPHIRQQACVVGASRRQLRICRATIAVSSTASSSSHLTNENSHDQGITTGVTLKIAVDSQGGLADLAAQTSDRFTAPSSLDMVHRLRADSQAVLIGRQTVVFDDPSLTVRRNVALVGSPPLRVVLDTRLSLLIDRALQGKNYQLFEDGLPTVVYHSVTDADEESLALPEWVDLVQLPPASEENSWVRVQDVWRDLQERYGVCHLMVEGGWATARAFLRAGLVDRLVLVRAPGVTFRDPVPSGITAESLGQEFQLERLGTVASEGDVMECWVRPGESWPTTDLSAWP